MTIEYNFLNLPESIYKEVSGEQAGLIQWRYDAVGNMLAKFVTTNHQNININPILSKEYIASPND